MWKGQAWLCQGGFRSAECAEDIWESIWEYLGFIGVHIIMAGDSEPSEASQGCPWQTVRQSDPDPGIHFISLAPQWECWHLSQVPTAAPGDKIGAWKAWSHLKLLFSYCKSFSSLGGDFFVGFAINCCCSPQVWFQRTSNIPTILVPYFCLLSSW